MPDTDVTLCALAGAVTIGAICATLAPPFSTTYRSGGNTECSARYSTVDAENQVGTSARVAQVSDTSTTEEVDWASGLFESSSSDLSLESTQGSHDSNPTLPTSLPPKQVDKIKDLVKPELEQSCGFNSKNLGNRIPIIGMNIDLDCRTRNGTMDIGSMAD